MAALVEDKSVHISDENWSLFLADPNVTVLENEINNKIHRGGHGGLGRGLIPEWIFSKSLGGVGSVEGMWKEASYKAPLPTYYELSEKSPVLDQGDWPTCNEVGRTEPGGVG